MGAAVPVLAALSGMVLVAAVLFVVRDTRQRKEFASTRPPAGTVLPGPGRVDWVPEPPDDRLVDRFTGGPLAAAHGGRNARGHRIRQVLRAQHRGYRAVAFVYTYDQLVYVRRLGTSPTRQYTVVSIDLPEGRPTLELSAARRPVAGQLRLGHDAFDAAFRLVSDSAEFARAVLPPAVIQWLLADPRARYFPIRIEGATVSTWTTSDVAFGPAPMRPEMINPMVDYLAEFLGHVPAGVWR
ncbi:hypothetical protein [Gandjariella thermophila]|uniref:DUF3137 domain-containing protein n=1 Tax=Gandjariella thermophila TaxID=1931992 RepID=A0A4D4J6E8_9PSEU|nr:hypothetical protein [Gandjariella thermophila]GDY32305.1 hypothetical protein GTS_39380 [Gandjariella thermophila]